MLQQVKNLDTSNTSGGGILRPIISIIIESGLASSVLIQPSDTEPGADRALTIIMGIYQMLDMIIRSEGSEAKV